MPKYTVEKAIWLGGLKQAAGSEVTLTEGQAKYWGHALTKVEDKSVAAAATAAKKPAKKADAPATAVVTEVGAKADGAGN